MIPPLTKRNRLGVPYSRPPEIEAALHAAVVQELEALRDRALIDDSKSANYLQSECLVHLIRQAVRHKDDGTTNVLLPLFLSRCERLLHSGVPDTVSHAADLREAILGRFVELFAEDGTGENPDELDFYEVRFNSAFRALRITVLRTQLSRIEHEVPFPDMDEADLSSEERAMPTFSPDLLDPNSHEQAVALRDLLNGLPVPLRRAIILCDFMGYEIESKDPTNTTAATICGVTGRTIRNRLREARRLLSIGKEHDQ